MNLEQMTARELLTLIAKAADTQAEPAPAASVTPDPATNANEELEAIKAENARLKAITEFGVTQEEYDEQSKFINFSAITPDQYKEMFGKAQPSDPEPRVDPVSKYATNKKPAPAINDNEPIDVAIAEVLGLIKK